MARQRRTVETDDGQTRTALTAEERKDMRAHDASGNVRPADGRWGLHQPQAESEYVRTSKGGQ